MDVESVSVVVAFGPGHDMRGPEQAWLGDAGHRPAIVPVGEQRLAENVPANTLKREALGLRRSRQPHRHFAEGLQRRVRQADAELIDPRDRRIQLGEFENSRVLTPGPPRPFVSLAISTATPGWLSDRSQGPPGDAPATQISPPAPFNAEAVVAAFCASVRSSSGG